MTKKHVYTLCNVLLVFLLGAAPGGNLQPADHIAIVLIVDNSGSMKTSDPQGLRFTGVQLFISLLDSDDALGLIVFSSQAKIMTEGLVPLVEYGHGADDWNDAKALEARGYTDLKAALENAGKMIEGASLENQKIEIVLLTDGKPEISNPYPQYEQETLDLARSLNIPIMAIALTSAAQTPFLEQLADETRGVVIPADDASDLLDAYLQVLGQIKDRTVIGGKAVTSATTLEIEQALAPYINSATFIVSKPESMNVQLLDPDGRKLSGDKSDDPRFSLVTLENPAGGMYAFRPQGRGEIQVWAILRSRLRVQIVSPLSVHPVGREMSIVVNLLEETTPDKFTKIIGEANFTALITGPDGRQTSLDRFYDDGTHGDVAANDGNYTRTFPDTGQEGGYLISIQGWKGAIPVSAEARVQALPFPELVIDAPLESLEMRGESVELKAHLQNADSPSKPRVAALVSSPSGEVQELEMLGSGSYTAHFMPLETGEYQVVFETRDAEYRGVEYQARTEHSFKVTVIPFAHVAVNEIKLPAACLSKPDEVFVTLMVNASNEGTLQLSALEGWEVTPGEAQVRKGRREIQLTLKSIDKLNAGIEHVELIVEGEGGLEVQPENALQMEIEIPGWRERCRTPLRFGVGILALALAGGAVMVRARKAERPLPVSGTLRHWEFGKSGAPVEIDLTVFGKNALLIGSGATCDVMIPHAELVSEHARIIAGKVPEGVEILLEPIGEVRKGYSQQIAPFTLRHGETFRMGAHEFQYLSDSGE